MGEKVGQPVRFFIDTEFSERGPEHPIELVSLAIVAEDGSHLYLINSDFEPSHANDWVKANVLPHLGSGPWYPFKEFAEHVKGFVTGKCGGAADGAKPEFWGYYSDYDWVVFCQIFGAMVDLPAGWPMFCLDLKQFCFHLGDPKLPEQKTKEHNALFDAQWNRECYLWLENRNS